MSNLVSPFVDDWHINVVDEDRHLLASRRTVRCTHTFVYVTLDSTLKQTQSQLHSIKTLPSISIILCMQYQIVEQNQTKYLFFLN